MPVSRLRHIPGIGVDKVGDAADAAADPRFLRLENLDTDLPPPAVARAVTRAAVDQDAAKATCRSRGTGRCGRLRPGTWARSPGCGTTRPASV